MIIGFSHDKVSIKMLKKCPGDLYIKGEVTPLQRFSVGEPFYAFLYSILPGSFGTSLNWLLPVDGGIVVEVILSFVDDEFRIPLIM